MQFRSDINGLRAIAVIAVTIYHYYSNLIPGGFVGVDIFFVISGYLMTGIIIKGLNNENFKLSQFYLARVNRIIPPLIVLCLFLLVFGWFFLTPSDYKILGKHAASSLTFLSNHIYLREAGYFDVASLEKFLLHTWSLSVEWQFYIAYPILLIIIHKIIKNNALRKIALISCTLIGLILCIFLTIKKPNAAYYLFIPRAWELMFGGVIYLMSSPLTNGIKKSSYFAGIALILFSMFMFTSKTPWPGYCALIPVVGTGLIIYSNNQHNKITNNLIFQYIGKWSYSIYLWHWPIVVIFTKNGLDEYKPIGILLSIILGFLSFRFVESRTKSSKKVASWSDIAKSKVLATLAITAILSYGVFYEKTEIYRFSKDKYELASKVEKEIVMPSRNNGYCFYSFNDDKTIKVNGKIGTSCFLGNKNAAEPVDTLLFGDSFAGHSDPFFDDLFNEIGKKYQSVSTNWCYPSFNNNFTGPKTHIAFQQCLLNRKFLQDAIDQQKFKKIIIAGMWSSIIGYDYFKDIEAIVQKAHEKGIKIIIMPIPEYYKKGAIDIIENQIYFSHNINMLKIQEKNIDKYNRFIHDKLNKYDNVYFIKPHDVFPYESVFHKYGIAIPYTLDGKHISMIGAKMAYEFFRNSDGFKEVIRVINGL